VAWQQKTWRSRLPAITVCVITILVAASDVAEKRASSQSGRIDGTSAFASGPVYVRIGSNTFIFDERLADSDGRIYPFRDGGPLTGLFESLEELNLSVKLTRRGLQVSMDPRTWDGKLAGQLRDNEWKTTTTAADRNFRFNAVEIIDTYGIPVLQVALEGPRTVRIQGMLFTSRRAYAVGTAGVLMTSLPTSYAELVELRDGAGNGVIPWFLYPSSAHFGELGPAAPPSVRDLSANGR
jgi:hypothetical protein